MKLFLANMEFDRPFRCLPITIMPTTEGMFYGYPVGLAIAYNRRMRLRHKLELLDGRKRDVEREQHWVDYFRAWLNRGRAYES